MPENRSMFRLAAILGFVAAVLAESAVVVRYVRSEIVDWRIAVAGLFIAALALNAWARSTPASSDRATGA